MVFDWDFYYGDDYDPNEDDGPEPIFDENKIIEKWNLAAEVSEYDYPF